MTRAEWVEAGARAANRWPGSGHAWTLRDEVETILAVAEPLIRADERERMERLAATALVKRHSELGLSVGFSDPHGVGWTPVATRLIEEWVAAFNDLAHAEAVAARLVEVICEMEEVIAGERMLARAAIKACNGLGRERDNLRAQIAADIEALPQWATWGPDGSLDDADVIDRQEALRIARGDA